MRLTVAVGLLLAALTVALVTRSAAAYYLASGLFVAGLVAGRIKIRRW